MLVTASATFPVFVNVTDCDALVVFTTCPLNVNVPLESDTAAPCPTPLTAIPCGLPVALSVIATTALRLPIAPAVNVTLIVHIPLAATDPPQLFVCAKSPLFAPATAMLVTVSGKFPVLVSVTDCAVLVAPTASAANVKLVAERETVEAVPVPVSVTDCGLPAALSAMAMLAPRAPVADGVNVTVIEQFADAATELPQVFVCAKSPLFVPVTPILVMESAVFPLLVSVTDCDALVAPTFWLPNAITGAERVAVAARPFPVSVIDCGLFGASSVITTEALRAPLALGVKVTLIEQLAFTAKVAPQVFVCDEIAAIRAANGDAGDVKRGGTGVRQRNRLRRRSDAEVDSGEYEIR